MGEARGVDRRRDLRGPGQRGQMEREAQQVLYFYRKVWLLCGRGKRVGSRVGEQWHSCEVRARTQTSLSRLA